MVETGPRSERPEAKAEPRGGRREAKAELVRQEAGKEAKGGKQKRGCKARDREGDEKQDWQGERRRQSASMLAIPLA